MKKVFKKVTAATMAATMVVGLALQQTYLDHSVRRSLMKQQKLLMSKYSMLTRDMFLKKLQHL